MNFLEIDLKRCTGCGLCSRVCPYKALEIAEGKAKYVLDECFLCGHCYSVCPEKAVVATGKLESDSRFSDEAYQAPGQVDPAMVITLMRSRRSCRNFLNREVSFEILEKLVEIGTTAPSGTNSQAWGFKILPGREDVKWFGKIVGDYYRKLNRLAEKKILRRCLFLCGNKSLERYYQRYYNSVQEALREWDEERIDRLFHGAPSVICVTGEQSASCPAEDALLATQNILLASHAMGLGSCLIGFAVEASRRSRMIKEELELQKGEELYSVIALGYPAVVHKRIAPRKIVTPQILRSRIR